MAAAAPAAKAVQKRVRKKKNANPQKPANANNKKKKSVGRPKKNFFLRATKGYKTAATGETRNSPTTDPNIIFWLGVSLIVFSGWSSGRIKNIFTVAWNGPSSGNTLNGSDAGKWATDLIHFGSQFIFVFLMVITARAIPPLARVWLVMIGGVWILYLMKNPQVLQLLNATATVGTPTPASTVTSPSPGFITNAQWQAILDSLGGLSVISGKPSITPKPKIVGQN